MSIWYFLHVIFGDLKSIFKFGRLDNIKFQNFEWVLSETPQFFQTPRLFQTIVFFLVPFTDDNVKILKLDKIKSAKLKNAHKVAKDYM